MTTSDHLAQAIFHLFLQLHNEVFPPLYMPHDKSLSNTFCIKISYLPYIYEKSDPVGFFSDGKEQFKSSTLFVISTTTVFVVFQMITIEYDCYSVTLNFILLPIYKKTNITSFMILSPEMLESFRHVWYKSFIFDQKYAL